MDKERKELIAKIEIDKNNIIYAVAEHISRFSDLPLTDVSLEYDFDKGEIVAIAYLKVV